MDFSSNYEISRTAKFIRSRNFTRVALQFPDELLKDSTKVVSALRDELRSLSESDAEGNRDYRDVGLFVMADTTYGNCCVDEVGASHVDAECVVHYGHTCLSPTSTLPALFVFGNASINSNDCAKSLSNCLLTNEKPIVVLFGLEYAHAIHHIKEIMEVESSRLCGSKENKALCYAEVICSIMDPEERFKTPGRQLGSFDSYTANGDCANSGQMNSTGCGNKYTLGGLTWKLPEGHKMDDYMIFWIGSDNPTFVNALLMYNNCHIVRYDAMEQKLVNDLSRQKSIRNRRLNYYVEKAKDANIVGILVGTLGVAGYIYIIQQMKELIAAAGKKAYTFVMGRPNPAKLANFLECNVFINVACPQTTLLDSKEYHAPIITPFEALLAFNRGSHWTGAYVMEFGDLVASSSLEVGNKEEEARFSFFQGGYVEDFELQGKGTVEEERSFALAEAAEKGLQVYDKYPYSLGKGTAKSGAEFFASRSYHGLEIEKDDSSPRSVVIGRSGKASGYKDEKSKKENT
ncbi:PREDICTED: diphthamide biosynthesis protein 2 [Nelumbo nucifera]|uniref:2-(3-amino-3-carboxypropyl)histidine synthase subunit 2 n=2 Tax=Nelumbo nucifera TaxID=4432 RepID=A0A1U7Z977_NELNU|nr:PREDICTED: diphthamide biosynthesis protein 2 [Nelumbo nucifera]DAD35932.1 TPA_asm: hypothetical protein HUJ06_006572 [Nelumbo nucifera]